MRIRFLLPRLPLLPAGMAALLALPSLAQDAASARDSAAFDLSGDWISLVTEDWQFRMVTPGRGAYGGVPVSAAGRRIAEAWDPAREPPGEECRAYGAPAIMRVPGRLRISWDDGDTLRIETEAGNQQRLFHFSDPAQSSERTWQGVSSAAWQVQGNLKVETSNLRAGYLRKNGVPYSERIRLVEFYDLFSAGELGDWLVVTTVVEDDTYLDRPYVSTSHFRRLEQAEDWNPTACSPF